MATMFDCAVVGAGPAGAAAALTLARAGRRVVLIEKEKLPRFKPCGGGVSPEVFSLLGAEPSPDAGVVASIDTATIRFDGAHEFSYRLEQPCLMVDRARFDHHLVLRAAASGAAVEEGSAVSAFADAFDGVRLTTSRGELTARFVVIADGAQGRSAALAGFRKKSGGAEGLAVAYETPRDTCPPGLIVDLGLMPCGYAWLFPKGDRVSVGIGITKRGGNERIIFERLALFAARSGVPFDRTLCRGARIAIWNGKRPAAAKGRFLLAGDAAGLVDPLSAEGLRPAVKSGIAAGRAVVAALAGDAAAIGHYEAMLREEFDRHFAVAARIARFFFLFPFLSYRTAFSHPRVGELMGAAFTGSLAYGDIAAKAIAALRKATFSRAPEQ